MKHDISKCYSSSVVAVVLAATLMCGISLLRAAEAGTLSIQDRFSPTGWMGDGEYEKKHVEFNGASTEIFHSAPTCIRISYAFGPKGWAGIYWLNKPDNWGDQPGENFATKRFTKVLFWARGERGSEVVEFKTGDVYKVDKKYHDSFSGTTGRVQLGTEWQQYEIDVQGRDLSSVIGGFCWVASRDYNRSDHITFYIDDITMN